MGEKSGAGAPAIPPSSILRSLSAGNARLKSLGRLARKAGERATRSELLVEGPTLLVAALDAGAEVREVYVDATAVGRPAVAAVLERLDSSAKLWSVPAGALDRVGDVSTSQGLVAVVARPEAPWPEPGTVPVVLVLDDVADPGNVGTLVRAAAAAGIGAVVVAGGADPSAPKVVRASAGALFGVDVVRVPLGDGVVDRLSEVGYRLLASVVAGGEAHDRVSLTGPLAIVVGNEARGVSEVVLAASDATVTIAMAGPTESLNAAMAGTLLCFEVLRRRQVER